LYQTHYKPVSLLRCAVVHMTADSAMRPTDLRMQSQQMYCSRDRHADQVDCRDKGYAEDIESMRKFWLFSKQLQLQDL
jgi:hypothetical protein